MKGNNTHQFNNTHGLNKNVKREMTRIMNDQWVKQECKKENDKAF